MRGVRVSFCLCKDGASMCLGVQGGGFARGSLHSDALKDVGLQSVSLWVCKWVCKWDAIGAGVGKLLHGCACKWVCNGGFRWREKGGFAAMFWRARAEF